MFLYLVQITVTVQMEMVSDTNRVLVKSYFSDI